MKNLRLLKKLVFVLSAAVLPVLAPAQEKPRPSPAQTAAGKIGDASVTIQYSSPAVKGRTIFGGLEPYDKVWRAGANEATTVETDKSLKVAGKSLPAGKYGFFLVPKASGKWTVIFNSVWNQWGAYKYDQAKDVLRVEAEPKRGGMTERLEYQVTAKGIVFRWADVELLVPVN